MWSTPAIGIWPIITTFILLLLSLFNFPDQLKLLYIQDSIVKTHKYFGEDLKSSYQTIFRANQMTVSTGNATLC